MAGRPPPCDGLRYPKKIFLNDADLSDLTIEQICQLFNYKTRKSYYDIRRWVLENNIEALLPKKTGPKSAPKRTSQLEKRVIQLRLTTDKNMYEITRQSIHTDLQALLKRGFTTTHAGGFFFIPYLMELGLYKTLPTLSV